MLPSSCFSLPSRPGGIILSRRTERAVSSLFTRALSNEDLHLSISLSKTFSLLPADPLDGSSSSSLSYLSISHRPPAWLTSAMDRIQFIPEIPPIKELIPEMDIESLLQDFVLDSLYVDAFSTSPSATTTPSSSSAFIPSRKDLKTDDRVLMDGDMKTTSDREGDENLFSLHGNTYTPPASSSPASPLLSSHLNAGASTPAPSSTRHNDYVERGRGGGTSPASPSFSSSPLTATTPLGTNREKKKFIANDDDLFLALASQTLAPSDQPFFSLPTSSASVLRNTPSISQEERGSLLFPSEEIVRFAATTRVQAKNPLSRQKISLDIRSVEFRASVQSILPPPTTPPPLPVDSHLDTPSSLSSPPPPAASSSSLSRAYIGSLYIPKTRTKSQPSSSSSSEDLTITMEVERAELMLEDGGEGLGEVVSRYLKKPDEGINLRLEGQATVEVRVGGLDAVLTIDGLPVGREITLGKQKQEEKERVNSQGKKRRRQHD